MIAWASKQGENNLPFAETHRTQHQIPMVDEQAAAMSYFNAYAATTSDSAILGNPITTLQNLGQAREQTARNIIYTFQKQKQVRMLSET